MQQPRCNTHGSSQSPTLLNNTLLNNTLPNNALPNNALPNNTLPNNSLIRRLNTGRRWGPSSVSRAGGEASVVSPAFTRTYFGSDKRSA